MTKIPELHPILGAWLRVVGGELETDDIGQFIADQLDALGSTSNAITIASTLRA